MNFLPVYSKSKMCKSFKMMSPNTKWCHQMLQNDVIKCCKMMSSNVALLHSNSCCVLEPAICEDLDLHVVIFCSDSKSVITTKYSRRSSLRFRLVQITWLTTPSLIYQKINGKGYRWCNCFYVCCDRCNWTWILGHLKDSNRSNFNVRKFFFLHLQQFMSDVLQMMKRT